METILWILGIMVAAIFYLNIGYYLRYARWSLYFLSGPSNIGPKSSGLLIFGSELTWKLFDPEKGLKENELPAMLVRIGWPFVYLAAALYWLLWLTFGGGIARLFL